MSSKVGTWIETTTYVAENPARVALLITLAQTGRAMDESTLAQMGGILHQQVAGHPIETALLVRHIIELGEKGLLQRDTSGFRWELTPIGALVSRQWAPPSAEPGGTQPLEQHQIRSWRDLLIELLDFDAGLADQVGLGREELLAVQSNQLAELRVMNRILADERLPAWLEELRAQAEGRNIETNGVVD